MPIKDLTNQKFGRLTALRTNGKNKKGNYLWLCQCECGSEKTIASSDLLTGNSTSCGCYAIEGRREKATTHGMSKTPEFKAWLHIKERCYGNSKDAVNYKERGIKVCQRWLDSFENFYADMGDRPSSNHSIDRINNDGNYCPENCRWATKEQQMLNQRRTLRATHQGETKTLKEWADIVGIHYNCLRARKLKGWTDEKILTTPIRKRG